MAPDKQITPCNAAQQLNSTTIGKRRELSHEVRARGSEGSRPIADQVDTYTYDSDGQLIAAESDDDGDGSADLAQSYTHDANRNVLTEAVDVSGSPYSTVTLTWVCP